MGLKLALFLARLAALRNDFLVFTGLCLIAAGLGWYSFGLAPLVFGLGLVAAVRYGGR